MFVAQDAPYSTSSSSVGATCSARNMPSLRDSRDRDETIFCYTHVAPTELKSGAIPIFQKVFDLLNMAQSQNLVCLSKKRLPTHETLLIEAVANKGKYGMTEWHRLFGLVLTDYFTGSSYAVELEKDLSLKRQFVDVIIIEQEHGEPLAEAPDGLEDLGRHNVLSYKSFQEPFSAWACDELLGHYVNYRKQVSPAMDTLLPESEFRLYGVSTRYPQKLAQFTMFHPVKSGVYDLDWGSRRIRLIVLNQIPETKRNAVWQLFSANPEHVAYGASHYQWRIKELSTILYGNR